jgi:2Fe-2S ferredoxin
MGGSNPFVEQSEVPLPRTRYRLTFQPSGQMVEVDPAALPYSRDGLPGSILEIALGHGIDIDHACGGVLACSTCHVYVRQGKQTCNEASEDEEDQLDHAPALSTDSRLACHCVPDGSSDVVIEIPGWNRNLVREDH